MINAFFKYASVPALLLLVALFQLYWAGQGLNRWRGGGFGMYSEFHYTKTVVLVKTASETSVQQDSFLLENPLSRYELQSVKIFPNENNIKKLAEKVARILEHNDFVIEVWKPNLQMDSLNYRRILKHRYDHKRDAFEHY